MKTPKDRSSARSLDGQFIGELESGFELSPRLRITAGNRSLTTAMSYVAEYQANHPDEVLHLKGYMLDLGSCRTHKRIIINLYEQGVDPSSILNVGKSRPWRFISSLYGRGYMMGWIYSPESVMMFIVVCILAEATLCSLCQVYQHLSKR